MRYIDNNIPVADVVNAVKIELDGGGQRLGYRNMNLKLRTGHNICVPRKLVSDVMYDLDPDGVEGRKVWKKAKPHKKRFVSDGPVFSLDGHDKMMGYQNSTFPLASVGALILFLERSCLFMFGTVTLTLC